MEPLSPQDPLHKLLGKAKVVEPRPNFTQNVLRAVRQLPQREGVWERLAAWLGNLSAPRAAMAGGLALLACVALFALAFHSDSVSLHGSGSIAHSGSSTVAQPKQSALTKAIAEEHADGLDFAQELDGMNQLTMVLAQQDTVTLSDADLALLLY